MTLGMVSIIPDEFTNEEKERITQLYGNDFKDIKPEDAQLIARWESVKTKKDEQFKAELAAFEAETNVKIEASKKQAEVAMNNLAELHAMAIARLERLQDGI